MYFQSKNLILFAKQRGLFLLKAPAVSLWQNGKLYCTVSPHGSFSALHRWSSALSSHGWYPHRQDGVLPLTAHSNHPMWSTYNLETDHPPYLLNTLSGIQVLLRCAESLIQHNRCHLPDCQCLPPVQLPLKSRSASDVLHLPHNLQLCLKVHRYSRSSPPLHPYLPLQVLSHIRFLRSLPGEDRKYW